MPSRALPPRAARTAAAASGWPSLGWMDGSPTGDTPRAGQENLHPVGGGGGGGGAGAAAAAAAPCAPGDLTAAHVNAAADAAAAVMQTVLAQQGARGDAALLPPSELAKLVASAVLTETMRLGMLGSGPSQPPPPPPPQQQQQQQQRRKTKAPVPVFGTSQHAALPTPEAAAQLAVRAVQDLAGLGGLNGMPFLGAGGAVSGGVLTAPPPAQTPGAIGVAANRADREAPAPAAHPPAAVFTANFTALQLRCVRKQLHEHTQLLLQVLALSARAPGPAMAAAASTTYSLLAGLVAARGAALEAGAGERYPVSLLTTPAPDGPLYCGPGGASWISVADESLIQGDDGVYGSDVEAWWPGAPTSGLVTLLDIPPLRHIPEFLAAVNKLPAAQGGQQGPGTAAGWSSEPNMLGGGADDDDTEADPDAMPKARRHRAQPPSAAALPVAHPVLRDLLALRFGHSRVSSPALVVQPSSWPRDQFTPGEDRLLATGFHTFGRNWAAVAQHLLPSRSTLQLSNRWKNATGAARNAKAVKGRSGAPLRAAAAAVTAPLTVNEAQALRAARTALLGQKSALTATGTPLVWSQLAAHCWRLGHVQRPAGVLQKLWKELLAATGCTNKAKGKGGAGASAPEAEAEPEPEEHAAHHEATMMGPMDGDDAWRDADVDPEAQPLGDAQQPDASDEPRGGDAPAGAASLLHFPPGDAPGCAVTARELRGSPAAPMDRYELMDAFMLQHQLCQAAPAGPSSIPAQAPQAPQAPVAVQAAPSAGRSGGWREVPPPPPPPVAPAGFHPQLPEPSGLGGEMPCHSNGGITALLADVGIHVAVTGAPSWAPPPMQPGRGRHGTASVRKRDAADDTQTVATGAGGGATSNRRRRVIPAPSVTAQPPAVAKKPQGGSGSGQAARKKTQGGEALGQSTGKRKRGSKPAASSAGGTNSGQQKSVPRPRPGARSGAVAQELPHIDDAVFVFDPADIPPEERIHGDELALKKRRLEAAAAGGGARPTVEHAAAATLSAMCAPLPRGDSPPSTGKRSPERERLPDSARKRVRFADAEHYMLSDSDEPEPPPPEPLPLSPPPALQVPLQQPPPQPVPVPVPAAEAPRAVEAGAPVAAALRDNEVMHEGEILQFSPAEDKAILIAARGAPQGKPTLMTFAMLLCDLDHPLLVGGKSAAQAQTRYLDLVRRMTAARAKHKAGQAAG